MSEAVAALVGFAVGFVTASGICIAALAPAEVGAYWRGGRRMGFGRAYLLWWWLFRR